MAFLTSFQQLILSALVVGYVVYKLGQTIYSVYLGPLSKFPGPKLAAATLWYEFYYDIIKTGAYVWRVKDMHEQYGPIVRISPNELHVSDPDFYEEVYSQRSPRDKSDFNLNAFDLRLSSFGTKDHRLHRMRRAALNPLFSKQTVASLEPVITSMIMKLCGRIDQFKESGLAMPAKLVYQCLTTDIVTLYTLNHSWHHLDSPDFSQLWVNTVKSLADLGHLLQHFPWLSPALRAIPESITGAINPGMLLVINFEKTVKQQTKDAEEGKYKADETHNGPRTSVFNCLLESDLPAEEKHHSRVWQDAASLIIAGSETTANALATTHYYLLADPEILARLKAELELAMPDKYALPKLGVVEQLPYLSAVIQEGLRLSYGVTARIARVAPTEALQCHGYSIPVGTPVSMDSISMHQNPDIFPEPHRFNPDRWLEKSKGGRSLDRYMVSFSKGSRACVGINLARAELYLTLAMVFRRYEKMRLFETTRKDVEVKHEMFLPQPDQSSRGVKVMFE